VKLESSNAAAGASTPAEGPGPSEAMRRYVNGETTPGEYLREVREETEHEVERRSDPNADRGDDSE
jgi:hypothetical protein